MFIVRTVWSGIPGMPGYTNFAFNSTLGGQPSSAVVTAAQGAVHAFMSGLQNFVPQGTSLQVEQAVRVVDPITGVLTGLVSADSLQPVVTSNASAGGYVGGAGAVIEWKTGLIQGSRVLAGRTFIVPLIASNFFNGQLTSAAQAALAGDAASLISGSATAGAPLGIWGRPRKAYTNAKGVAIPARGGAFAVVTSGSVPPFNALLRSRRD